MGCGTEALDLRSLGKEKPKSKHRIILDRSAFTTVPRFGNLKGALASVVPHRAEVLVTPRLLDETLKLWLDNPRSVEAREHLEFILRIGSPRWFNQPVEISKLELCAYVLPDEYWFFLPSVQRSLEQKIMASIEVGRVPPEGLRSVVREERKLANRLHERGVKLRSAMHVRDDWDSILEKWLNHYGQGAIAKKGIYQEGKKSVALNTWAGHKDRCPFFTAWVKGILYSDFYAAHYKGHKGLKIDEHPQADIEHLLYLEQADVLVSEDKKFMRQAFIDLYRDRGKQYWTLDDLEQWASG